MSPKPDLVALREGGAILSSALSELAQAVAPGVTTTELNEIAERHIRKHGGTPAFLGHRGFPAALCTSVNHQIVHGIPGDLALQDGDIISLDLGVKLSGWYTDAAITVPVGTVDEAKANLLDITRSALKQALSEARSERTTGDLGAAVQRFVEAADCAVIRDCVGHGIGRHLHEDPSIPNFGTPGEGTRFKSGMVVAIEPMVVTGSAEIEIGDDGWTISSRDRSPAAHFEETVLITEGAPERLTPLPEALRRLRGTDRLGKVA